MKLPAGSVAGRRIVAVALLLAVAAAVVFAVKWRIARPAPIEGVATVRATHYWAGGYPKSFWDGLDPSRVDADFARIRQDGFNTVVLAVSWPEFQPRLTPTPAYDERAFGDLAMLIRKAGEHGLRVALRVGFIWSFRPDAELPNAMRVDAAFHDAAIHAAWLDFVGEVCRRVCDSPHVVMGFLSWEDLFPFNLLGDAPNRDHLGFRREFVGWLRTHHALADVGAKYGRSFASWADVPLPERRSPAYEYVLAWWDDALVERFFLPARQRFPRLSFEARVDWDPVWHGERIDWYRHDVQLRRAGAEVATVYYAVAWGMKNDGDSTDAPSALAQLDRLLASAAGESRARSLFIDQFNFVDNTPEFSRNTRLADDQYDAMLAGAADVLTRRGAGYAVWVDQDYASNILYNPGFQRGLAGWEADGGVNVIAQPDGAATARLAPGAGIAQRIVAGNREAGFLPGRTGKLCLHGRAVDADSARVDVAGLPGAASLTFDRVARRRCADVPLAAEFRLALAAQSTVELDRIELFHHVQQSRLRELDGAPGPQAEALRALNRELARRTGS